MPQIGRRANARDDGLGFFVKGGGGTETTPSHNDASLRGGATKQSSLNQASKRLKIKLALVPPKPKLFDII